MAVDVIAFFAAAITTQQQAQANILHELKQKVEAAQDELLGDEFK